MSDPPIRIQPLPARTATPAAIAPYATLIEPGEDGTPFGAADAVLDLGRGTPRLYTCASRHGPCASRPSPATRP